MLCLIIVAGLIGYLVVRKHGKLSADEGGEHAGTSLDYMYSPGYNPDADPNAQPPVGDETMELQR
jgi:hypothetical protein